MAVRPDLFARLAAPFARRERPYRCRNCETAFELQHHVCPECGSYAVERDAWAA
ncbi:MAG: 50S ribosomal protein L32 [Haloarculaceae archaeon]